MRGPKSVDLESDVVHPIVAFDLQHDRVTCMESRKFSPQVVKIQYRFCVDSVDHISGPQASINCTAVGTVRNHHHSGLDSQIRQNTQRAIIEIKR